MADFVWCYPLDGVGEEAVDLHECRRFHIWTYDGHIPEVNGLTFYMMRGGRWILFREYNDIFDVESEWPHQKSRKEYEEVCREQVANFMLKRDMLLPPMLEIYRKYGDDEEFRRWAEQYPGTPAENGDRLIHSRPMWSPAEMRLSFRNVTCLQYVRQASEQFKLLKEFQSAQWPESIKSPFPEGPKLQQTIRDMNKKLSHGSPLRFACDHLRASWWMTR